MFGPINRSAMSSNRSSLIKRTQKASLVIRLWPRCSGRSCGILLHQPCNMIAALTDQVGVQHIRKEGVAFTVILLNLRAKVSCQRTTSFVPSVLRTDLLDYVTARRSAITSATRS